MSHLTIHDDAHAWAVTRKLNYVETKQIDLLLGKKILRQRKTGTEFPTLGCYRGADGKTLELEGRGGVVDQAMQRRYIK